MMMQGYPASYYQPCYFHQGQMVPILAAHRCPIQLMPPPLSMSHRMPLRPDQAMLATRMQTYYDCLVVIDFEATCDEPPKIDGQRSPPKERPEIIQFPAVLVDVRRQTVIDTFNSFVKPVEEPMLSDFCKNLTGITQEMVDAAPQFTTVLKQFEKWLLKHGLNNKYGKGRTFAIVTDGSYDIGHFLLKQCLISDIPLPVYARRYVNIRTTYWKLYGYTWFSLRSVLEGIGERFEGRQHNGLDDARNIAKVLMKIIGESFVVRQTEKVLLNTQDQAKKAASILSNKKRAHKYDLPTVSQVNGSECLFVAVRPQVGVVPIHPEVDNPDLNDTTEVDNKENIVSSSTVSKKSSKKNILKASGSVK